MGRKTRTPDNFAGKEMKIAVFTSIVGGYDSLIQPVKVHSDFDFICFVENGGKKFEKAGVWQVRELPELPGLDAAAISRYPKMNPHLLLPEYEYSVWIDGNIGITEEDFYLAILEKTAAGVKYSGVPHPFRSCAYEEARHCCKAGLISSATKIRLLRFLRSNGFPKKFGLAENGIILRSHNDRVIRDVDELWWNCYLTLSRRDQLSLTYCLWKNGMLLDQELLRGKNVRNCPSLVYIPHHFGRKPKGVVNWIFKHFAGKGCDAFASFLLKLSISARRLLRCYPKPLPQEGLAIVVIDRKTVNRKYLWMVLDLLSRQTLRPCEIRVLSEEEMPVAPRGKKVVSLRGDRFYAPDTVERLLSSASTVISIPVRRG